MDSGGGRDLSVMRGSANLGRLRRDTRYPAIERMLLLNEMQQRLCSNVKLDFPGLRALFINCTLKRSPERSHTDGRVDIAARIMETLGVGVDRARAIRHDIATGVYSDISEHGWKPDVWSKIYQKVQPANILVLAAPIWLGKNLRFARRSLSVSMATPRTLSRRASRPSTARLAAVW